MSINEHDDEKGKDEPLIKDDGAPDDSPSKAKIFLLYGATVGGMLLVVIIVFIIALAVGGSSGDKFGSIVAKYRNYEDNAIEIEIISSKYKEYISSIKVDEGEKQEYKEKYSLSSGVHTIEIFFNSQLEKIDELFKGCSNLEEVNLDSFPNKDITDMSGMFYGCINLKVVDFGKDTTSKVTNMTNLFYNCPNLNQTIYF